LYKKSLDNSWQSVLWDTKFHLLEDAFIVPLQNFLSKEEEKLLLSEVVTLNFWQHCSFTFGCYRPMSRLIIIAGSEEIEGAPAHFGQHNEGKDKLF
jgi:hypothetical protein